MMGESICCGYDLYRISLEEYLIALMVGEEGLNIVQSFPIHIQMKKRFHCFKREIEDKDIRKSVIK